MSAEQRVHDYLVANAGRQYCDDCLSAALQIKPRQQVQQKTSNLAHRPCFRRGYGICSRCYSNKVVIHAVDALGNVVKKIPQVQETIKDWHRAPIGEPLGTKDAADLTEALVLVSCVKSKQPYSAPARQLYTSAWFRGVRDLVEASGARWFVLSSLYGLVAPDAVIEPYDHTLNSIGVSERQAWAKGVLDKLLPETAGFKRIVMFAGQRYREYLIEPLRRRGITVEIPMKNLRRGEQLAWLTHQQ